MVHVDVKKVGRIPDGGGWRVHGKGSAQAKAVAVATAAGKRAGYVYLHSAVDGYSRLTYTEALTDEKAITAIGFMHRARVWFAAHELTSVLPAGQGVCKSQQTTIRTSQRLRQFSHTATKVTLSHRFSTTELQWKATTLEDHGSKAWNAPTLHRGFSLRRLHSG